MSDIASIVIAAKDIDQIIEADTNHAPVALFEHYRIRGSNRDAFVAALIGRLCLLESQRRLDRRDFQ